MGEHESLSSVPLGGHRAVLVVVYGGTGGRHAPGSMLRGVLVWDPCFYDDPPSAHTSKHRRDRVTIIGYLEVDSIKSPGFPFDRH